MPLQWAILAAIIGPPSGRESLIYFGVLLEKRIGPPLLDIAIGSSARSNLCLQNQA